MKFRTDIDAETLRQILHYDPETGLWHWLQSRRYGWIGKQAGTISCDGYRMITILGQHCISGRLAWLYMTGEWPPFEIDHSDMNCSNDKWNNLRAASHTQNQGNRKCRNDSQNGMKGVHKSYNSKRYGQRYIARIQYNGKRLFLGYFQTIEEAKTAHDVAAQKLFGEFSRF